MDGIATRTAVQDAALHPEVRSAKPAARRLPSLGPKSQAAVGLGLCLLLAMGVERALYLAKVSALARADAQRLEFFAISLQHALEKHEPLPFLLGLERDVIGLLQHPDDPQRAADVNRYLELVQSRAAVAAAFVLDQQGRTVAASNWATSQSFVGHNYAFRPYFRDALVGSSGRFYAVGATTGEPGYFLSSPVRAAGRVIGVVVVKVSLATLEQAWIRSGEYLLVSDENSVVFLGSVPEWKYRTLAPLSPEARERLGQTRQYASPFMPPLIERTAIRLDGVAQTVKLQRPADGPPSPFPWKSSEFLVQSRPAGPLGWHVVLLSDLQDARLSALGGGSAAGFAAAFALTALVYLQARRRGLRERRETRAALQRAYEELEQRIAERTAELVAANDRLGEKVAALKRTEQILRETQDNAVQAGKLAVLGQMAAGITHELNQPLAALTTLPDNAAKFMELGRLDDVRSNLLLMSQLTQKMGRIVGQLKAFARKGPVVIEPVAVAEAVANALALVEAQRREADASIEVDQPDASLQVLADGVRLEQVLVNLLRNGLEAMESCADRRLLVSISRRATGIQVAIRDHGPGIAEEAREHLFEPFFTTKPRGKGLGLGLAISLAIVQSVGGELTAANASDGGAEFLLKLVEA